MSDGQKPEAKSCSLNDVAGCWVQLLQGILSPTCYTNAAVGKAPNVSAAQDPSKDMDCLGSVFRASSTLTSESRSPQRGTPGKTGLMRESNSENPGSVGRTDLMQLTKPWFRISNAIGPH